MTAITGPIAPYQNLPIQPQNYQPRWFFIENVTRGVTTLVTTTVNHDYVIGQLVRLIIPFRNGIRQLNEVQGLVIEIPSPDQVVLNIDSQAMDAFVTSSARTQPQIVPTGDLNSGQVNTGRTNNLTYIPGSFINISPA